MPDYKIIPNPGAPHPFSFGVASDDLIFISGFGGHDMAGNIDDDAASQARQAIATVEQLLTSVGSSLSEIVFLRPMVTRREYASEIDAVFRELLPEPKPAGGALLICDLADPRMKMEIEVIAHRGAKLV